jgi:hypothetical protein
MSVRFMGWFSGLTSKGKVCGGLSGYFQSGALGLGLGGEDLVARQRLEHLQVVPGLLGLGGRLHLDQVHVVDEAAVGADLALAVEVVDLHALELRHHLVGVGGLGGGHGLQVGHGGRVVGGLHVGGHALGLLEEAVGELARVVVQVPVPAGGVQQAFGVLQAQAVDVAQEDQQAGGLHGLVDAEFLGRLDRVDGVAARVGQAQDLRLGVLRLQQERREVRCVQRMAHRAHHGAALLLHDLGGVGFERMAEGVVGRQEEPALAAAVDHGRAGALGQRHGVVGVVDGVGAALLVGEHRAAGAVVEVHALLLFGHLGGGQRHARVGAAEDHRHAGGVDPFAGLGGGDVGLVLVVGHQQLDGLAQRLAAEVVDGHLDGGGAALAFEVGVQARQVGDEADLHFFLRLCGACAQREDADGGGDEAEFLVHGVVS